MTKKMSGGLPLAVFLLGAGLTVACGNSDSSPGVVATDARFDNLLSKLSAPEREQFAEFVKFVDCNSTNCSVQDMAFAEKEEIADYFYNHVLGKREKGLVVASSKVFTAPVTVCWTDDSDATDAEKAATIANIEATWATYANISFDWYSSGTTPRTCTQAQSTAYNLKIWQDSSQTRGCSYVGKNTAVGIGCTGSVAHPWANMLLEVRRGTNRDSYVSVHEFGHAIGIYHEMDRADSTCTSGAGSEPSSSRRVGDYDPESIMNYCAAQNGNISSGDVQSAIFMYGGPSVSPVFRARSWYSTATSVTYTASLPDGTSTSHTQSSVSDSPSNFSFGAAQTGAWLDVTPADSTLRCFVRSEAPRLRNNLNRILYFTGGTLPTECYSPALVTSSIDLL